MKTQARSVLRPSAAFGSSVLGLKARPTRTILTAIGIAIGIASLVAVVGISASAKADVVAQIEELGTDLLAVKAGTNTFGESSPMPVTAAPMVRRIGPVNAASAITEIAAHVQRNDLDRSPNGLSVLATETDLLSTIRGEMDSGRWLDGGETSTVVLGSTAAERLAITSLEGSPTVDIAGRRFGVIGILEPLPLHPDIDRSVLIDDAAAEKALGVEIVPSQLLVRSSEDHVESVREVLARTVNPTDPNEVSVSRPSDALEARAAVDKGLQSLLLGLGSVSLLVGGIGIANVMVVAVMERRGEIGLRRSLGATRRHIAIQFVLESSLLSLVGGLLGTAIGIGVTAFYADRQGWMFAVPTTWLALAVVSSVLLGALAGLHPATRAARLDPAEAIRPA